MATYLTPRIYGYAPDPLYNLLMAPKPAECAAPGPHLLHTPLPMPRLEFQICPKAFLYINPQF